MAKIDYTESLKVIISDYFKDLYTKDLRKYNMYQICAQYLDENIDVALGENAKTLSLQCQYTLEENGVSPSADD